MAGGRTDLEGCGDPVMSASEWIVVPGAAGAAVLRPTDVRPEALDLEEVVLLLSVGGYTVGGLGVD